MQNVLAFLVCFLPKIKDSRSAELSATRDGVVGKKLTTRGNIWSNILLEINLFCTRGLTPESNALGYDVMTMSS